MDRKWWTLVAGTAGWRSGVGGGLDDLLIVTAALAIAGALGALALIRGRDFVRAGRTEPEGASPAATEAGRDGMSRVRSE